MAERRWMQEFLSGWLTAGGYAAGVTSRRSKAMPRRYGGAWPWPKTKGAVPAVRGHEHPPLSSRQALVRGGFQPVRISRLLSRPRHFLTTEARVKAAQPKLATSRISGRAVSSV